MSANWAFRFAANDVVPRPNSVARRLLMMVVLPWQLLPAGSPWQIPLNLGFSMLGIDLVLLGFECIPFTYRVQTDSRQMVVRFILALVGMLFLIPLLLWLERWAIVAWWRYAILAAAMFLVWLDLQRRRRMNERDLHQLSFEQRAPSDFELLKLA